MKLITDTDYCPIRNFDDVCSLCNCECISGEALTPDCPLIRNGGTPYNPSGDCISRNAVIRMFNTMDRYKADKLILQDTDKEFPKNEVFIVDDCYEQLDLIDNAQAIPLPNEQVAWEQGYEAGLAQGKAETRPQGEWIPMSTDCRGYSESFKCSICGAYIYPRCLEKELDYNGCPYCFADMQKGGAE